VFFFEKKNQKTFATGGQCLTPLPVPESAPKWKKFFGSFFQKRTTSLLSDHASEDPRPVFFKG
jgi:hypothetical protein